MSVAEQAFSLLAANQGYLDDVEVNRVVAFEDAMQAHLKSNNQDLLDMINETGDYNDDINAKMIAALDNFKQTGTY